MEDQTVANTEVPPVAQSPEAAGLPLCVDLDGTLVKSDTLMDSVLLLARQRPWMLLRLPGWMAEGKAALKRRIAAAATLDVEHLPYNRELLAYLRQQYGAGRPLYLATASDIRLAERVAAFLGIFHDVLASDGVRNLSGQNKLAELRERFGKNFCYIGNASPDVPALAACREPMTANGDRALRRGLRQAGVSPARNFVDRSSGASAWLRAARLHQWAKNVLLFLPLLLAHAWRAGTLAGAATGFVSFGLCASATYIINDLLDIDADRRHPRKRLRPFASGDLTAQAGIGMVALLFACSAALALLLPRLVDAADGPALPAPYGFFKWLVVYAITTLAYSLLLKRRLLLDVFVLSGLYTLRILAGSAASGVPVSEWLAGFSVFFFLSLAFIKRFSELEAMNSPDLAERSGRAYRMGDLEQLRSFGTGTGCAAAVVLTLYIHDSSAAALYHHAQRLWLIVPVLLLWLFRLWMVASRGELEEDPVVYAITDKRSLLLGMLLAAIVFSAL